MSAPDADRTRSPTPAGRARRSRAALRPSSEHRQAALRGERVERLLHDADEVVVNLVEVRVSTELLAQVDRGEGLDRDLRRKRYVAQHVADVEAPWDRDRDRQDLEAE